MNIEDLDAVKRLVEPIASEIANLSSRITQNRSAVSASEAATRIQLIEPLMRVLGWDASDPNLVTPEYSVGKGRVDYALMQNREPIVLIEAKKHGTKLTTDTLFQAFSYVEDVSVKFVVISNGDDWEVYRTPIFNREPVARFTVTDDSAHATALEAAQLSRQMLTETAIGFSGRQTRYEVPAGADTNVGPELRDDSTKREQPVSQGEQKRSVSRAWSSLDEVTHQKDAPPPCLLRFPDGCEIAISAWRQLWIQVAEWVVQREPRMEACKFGDPKHMAIKSNDEDFWGKGYRLSNGLWIEGGLRPDNVLKTSCALLRYFDIDPSTVLVKFD